MSKDFQQLIDALSAATLDGAGESSPELRRSVANYATSVSQDEMPVDGRIATELIPYINNVALHAYKISDADVNRLKLQDYSEDEIFELTVSAALGAGLARLECGLELLNN